MKSSPDLEISILSTMGLNSYDMPPHTPHNLGQNEDQKGRDCERKMLQTIEFYKN